MDLLVEQKVLDTLLWIDPKRCAYLGDAQLWRLLRRGVEEAARFGMSTPRGRRLVIWMMFAMGHGFTEDPLFPWVSATLLNRSPEDIEECVVRLETQVRCYMDQALNSLERRLADG
ncbi:hypothetical protein ACN28S_19560 [Cystobacter fuscus]